IRALIVEDEGVAARRLEKLLKQLDIQVIGQCDSNKTFEQFLNGQDEPDLYFLDIHLSDGIIFDLLQKRPLRAPIIFTTAYDQYAIKAFKQNSIDYLLKPVEVVDLRLAIDKFKQLHQQNPPIDIQTLSQLIQRNTKTYRNRIMVKVGDHLRTINMAEVTHIYSAQKITFLHVADGRSYPIDRSVDKIMDELDPEQFHRISRSHLISINYITDVISYSSSRLKIKLRGVADQEIVVSRDRVKGFKAWLG
ncbi:MAG: LytTR family DNA-binding domain-containing protein, partial [Bacteroidota bacterium]